MLDQLSVTILGVSSSILSIFLAILGIVLSYFSSFNKPSPKFKKNIHFLVIYIICLIIFNCVVSIFAFYSIDGQNIELIKVLFLILLILIPLSSIVLSIAFLRRIK